MTQYQRAGQEGSRWVNVRPSGDEVAKWFTENVPMHDGMQAEDFLTGVTLIPAKAKEDEITGFRENGSPVIEERQNLHFVPYIKVETRIAYFWRWMALNPDWLGCIEPIGGDPDMPPGFTITVVKGADGKDTTFLNCTMQVRILKRDSIKVTRKFIQWAGDRLGAKDFDTFEDVPFVETRKPPTAVEVTVEGEPIYVFPPATKAVNLLGRYGPDENARMKAETGAIGRALGFAGVLVAPGSGVATAEDMQDAAAAASRVTAGVDGSDDASLPQEGQGLLPEDEGALRDEARRIISELNENHPEALAEFQRWAKSRRFGSLNALVNPALKGVVRKLRNMLAEADARTQQAPADEDVSLGGEQPPDEPLGGPEPEPEPEASAEPSGGEAEAEPKS